MARHRGGVFKRREMPGIRDRWRTGAGDTLGNLAMCFERADLLVLAGKDQRRHVDLAKARPAVGAMDGDLRLLGQHVGACIAGHGANDVTQALIADIGRRDQASARRRG